MEQLGGAVTPAQWRRSVHCFLANRRRALRALLLLLGWCIIVQTMLVLRASFDFTEEAPPATPQVARSASPSLHHFLLDDNDVAAASRPAKKVTINLAVSATSDTVDTRLPTAMPDLLSVPPSTPSYWVDDVDLRYSPAETASPPDRAPAPLQRVARGVTHPIQQEMLPYVEDMLDHALHHYFLQAFPHDDLRSLTGAFTDTFSGVGITLLDSLDTLALAGRHRTFRRAARWVETHLALATQDELASAFEVNIRALGGLLAAHYMYEEGVVPIVRREHDYKGGLLRLAQDLADRLLRVFDSPTGLPFNRIRLRQAEANTSQAGTTNADAGTYLLEFTMLSHLTGNASYAERARRATQLLHDMREPATQLMNLFVDVHRGEWSANRETGIGACLDSTLEYAVKYHVLTGEVQEWREYERDRRAASAWLREGGFYYGLHQGDVLVHHPANQGLSAFYPGNMLLGGHHTEAAEGVWAVHGLMKQMGVLVEDTDLRKGVWQEPQYRLRPEHIESIYYLYRATHDPVYLEMGKEFALGLQLRTRVPYGFVVLTGDLSTYSRSQAVDYMESYLIAETFKYLYLLFDETNAVHGCADGKKKSGQDITVPLAGWVFTTEAHVLPNGLEQWGLTESAVQSGRRAAPVRTAYTAYMFDTPAEALMPGEAPLQESEAALVAEAAEVRERWLLDVQLDEVETQATAVATEDQDDHDDVEIVGTTSTTATTTTTHVPDTPAAREAKRQMWETAVGLSARQLRKFYRHRAAQATESVAEARQRHVRGLLCAAHQRRRRQRCPSCGPADATRSDISRAAAEACANDGPVLRSPFFTASSPPYATADVVNPVHRHYSDRVGHGAYEYFCDIAHLRGVRRLSRAVYRPIVSLREY